MGSSCLRLEMSTIIIVRSTYIAMSTPGTFKQRMGSGRYIPCQTKLKSDGCAQSDLTLQSRPIAGGLSSIPKP